MFTHVDTQGVPTIDWLSGEFTKELDDLSVSIATSFGVPSCCIYASSMRVVSCPSEAAYVEATLDGRTPCALVARDGRALSHDDVRTDRRIAVLAAFQGPARVVFYLAVPILRGDVVIGALSVFARHAREPRATDAALLASFAAVLSRRIAAHGGLLNMRERFIDVSVRGAAQRRLLETAPGFFFILSPDDRFLMIRGYPVTETTRQAERIVGMKVREAMSPELADQLSSAAERARSTDTEQRLEYSFEAADRRYYCDTHVVADAQGNALFLAFDVTRRVHAESQARDREELIGAIADAQDAFISGEKSLASFGEILRRVMALTQSEQGFIAETRRTSADPWLMPLVTEGWPEDSAWFARLRGGEASGETARRFDELVKSALREGTACAVHADQHTPLADSLDFAFAGCASIAILPLVKGGEAVGALVVANSASGFAQHALDSLKPYLSTLGNILGAYRADLGRQLSEVALAASEARLRGIVDTAADVIVSMSDDGTIEDINPAVRALLQYDPDELRGRHIHDIIPRDPGAARDSALRRDSMLEWPLMLGLARETEARRRDGLLVPVELGISALSVGDRQLFTAIIRDVTQRRRLAQAKTEFVSAVSHELRTPLTSIRGALGLLVGGVVGEIPDEARSMIAIAFKNCDRLVRLINDILEIEKAGSGEATVELKTVRLIDAVQASVDALAGYASEHDVHVAFHIKPHHAHVLANDDRLAQVLANIISNAIKFSPPDGTVEVRVVEAEETFVVEVRDQGPGIPESFKERVFQRFAQADSSDTRSKGGTGLGLAIVYELLQQMNGRVWFESSSAGTTFFVELSAIDEIPQSIAPPSSRALVCSSDLGCVNQLRQALYSFGCDVEHAEAIDAARARVSVGGFDVVVLDTLLGDFAVARIIQDLANSSARGATRVVVVSAGREPVTFIGDMVISAVITRPLDHEQVLETVRSAFLGWGPEAPSILYVEDDDDLARMVRKLLPADWRMTFASTVSAAKELLSKNRYHALLLDLALPDGDGEELISCAGNTPVVVLSARELPEGFQSLVRAALVKTKVQERQIRYTLMQAVRRPSERADLET